MPSARRAGFFRDRRKLGRAPALGTQIARAQAMEPQTINERSKVAVRWLIIAILLGLLLAVARHVQS
jgi:hypothetical protein